MDWSWFTYERMSLILAAATVLFSIVAIVIAIWSSRQATKQVSRLINDTNRATRVQIAVEISKLDVEKFRLSMHMLELKTKKERLQAEPNQNQQYLLEPSIPEQIKLIDEEYERCDRLYKLIQIVEGHMNDAVKKIC